MHFHLRKCVWKCRLRNGVHFVPASMSSYLHDDVIKWKHFLPYWPFVRRIHRFPVNSPHIIPYLGMKSWDLHVCDRASTITHVDRVKKSNPWYNKISLCLNVTIWSSQICLSVIFIYFVKFQNIWEKNCTYSHFFQSPVTVSAYFWSALKAC